MLTTTMKARDGQVGSPAPVTRTTRDGWKVGEIVRVANNRADLPGAVRCTVLSVDAEGRILRATPYHTPIERSAVAWREGRQTYAWLD